MKSFKWKTNFKIMLALCFVILDPKLLHGQKKILVSAAISLSRPLATIIKKYESTQPVKVNLNFNSSGILVQQILHGSPTDIFISANKIWYDELVKEKYIQKKFSGAFIKNSLALVTPTSQNFQTTHPKELLQPEFLKIAIGDYRHVPVGMFAQKALKKNALFNDLKKKMVISANAYIVLAYVEKALVEAGFVYHSDARNNPRVKISYVFPEEETGAIEYYIGVIQQEKQDLNPAIKLAQFIRTSYFSQDTFQKNGFIALKP